MYCRFWLKNMVSIPVMFKQLLTTANGDSSMGVEFVTYAVNAGVYPCGN